MHLTKTRYTWRFSNTDVMKSLIGPLLIAILSTATAATEVIYRPLGGFWTT